MTHLARVTVAESSHETGDHARIQFGIVFGSNIIFYEAKLLGQIRSQFLEGQHLARLIAALFCNGPSEN